MQILNSKKCLRFGRAAALREQGFYSLWIELEINKNLDQHYKFNLLYFVLFSRIGF